MPIWRKEHEFGIIICATALTALMEKIGNRAIIYLTHPSNSGTLKT